MANTSPLFVGAPNFEAVKIPATNAVTTSDGVSTGNVAATNMTMVLSCGANGSFVERVRFIPVFTSAVNSVATTVRVFISTESGGVNSTTAANTALLGEIAIPATASGSTTIATPYYDLLLNLPAPPNTYILACQHVSQGAGNGQFQVLCFGMGSGTY
jgi:hypothetical protein